jgi:hypothetical protein
MLIDTHETRDDTRQSLSQFGSLSCSRWSLPFVLQQQQQQQGEERKQLFFSSPKIKRKSLAELLLGPQTSVPLHET